MATTTEHQLRLGRWEQVLSDVTCDALIFDAPYSTIGTAHGTRRGDGYESTGLRADYDAFTARDVRMFCEAWADRCRGWMASLTDFALAPIWKAEMERIGRCTFAPVVCVIRGMSVRIQCDGPSNWTLYAMVSRPRTAEWASWGVRDGAYTGGTGTNSAFGDGAGGGRGKPRWLMNALVRDYTRAGDLVCDPFAGWGSTAASCAELGRAFVGAECDATAHAEAVRRLGKPQQLSMEVA